MISQKRTVHKPLGLQAKDPRDLKILSSLLQDALIRTGGMHFNPKTHQFTLRANRFCWEEESKNDNQPQTYQRTHSGVHFSHVNRVRQVGIDRAHAHKFHNLLTVHADKEGEIHLIFSGKSRICLHVDQILCLLADLRDPWWSGQQPEHEN